MKKMLSDYKEVIKKLPLKDKYTREELLTSDFLIDKQDKMEIYYAPHNEYINQRARIFIIGITPGFQQMNMAIATARKELELNENIKVIQYKCKVSGRFSGSLRKNIISMLNEIELNKILDINSCDELFSNKDYLLHTVSLIPYSVFVNKQNYTGHTPKLLKNEFLMQYVYDNFVNELQSIKDHKKLLLIPLGKAVEEVLCKLQSDGVIDSKQILRGFPHPSGANVNRISQLQQNKDSMIKFLRMYFE
ncbi:hypothetical protein [Hathewaya limosa]|uniref:YoxB n=1 Tax=Hathewaya limosa TaxID=1536 RepID=A0ABU0JNL9_HATLI|nr:hypothetical protein [Hathewaya limosa]MDQ0478665.1 hypothetical protein [Hathewaya limosa]